MGNDCFNDITLITYDKSQGVNNIFGNYLRGADVKVKKKWSNGIKFRFISKCNADYEWLESLIDTYPGWWIKNEWWEEGGNAGVWVGHHKNDKKTIKHIEWEDVCIEELLHQEANLPTYE